MNDPLGDLPEEAKRTLVRVLIAVAKAPDLICFVALRTGRVFPSGGVAAYPAEIQHQFAACVAEWDGLSPEERRQVFL